MEDQTSKVGVIDFVVVVLTSHSLVVCSRLAVLICKNVGLIDVDTGDRVETLTAVHVTLAVTQLTVEDVGIDRRDQ